jgi:hypothetical protein
MTTPLRLSDKWLDDLKYRGETGMGYLIASVLLKNGSRFDQVVIERPFISGLRGHDEIPFSENDIEKIIVTHEKWDWKKSHA